MVDLLVATVAFVLVVALALLALVALVVLPLYAALQMADSRRFSTARWAAFTAIGVIAGLGHAYVLHRSDDGPRLLPLLPLLPLVLTWAGPGVLWLLDGRQERVGGRAGRHE
jgi:hypothetical protein